MVESDHDSEDDTGMTGNDPRADSGYGGHGLGRPAGLPLPAGAVIAGFDSGLRVIEVTGRVQGRHDHLLGMPLGEAIGTADLPALQRAAWSALEGRTTTISCALEGTAAELVVNLAPHPGRPGYGLALVLDGPERAVGDSRERERAEELELISTAARELARSTHSDEARATICEAAQSVCGAEVVVLLEPDEGAFRLLATASRGLDANGAALPLNESSGAAMALRTNVPQFLADPAGESPAAAAFLREAGLESVLWQPVSRGRTVRAVLCIGWTSRISAVHERAARLLEFIAVEGAVAIDRGSAFGRLVAMARSDPLTGLGNRRAWEEELRREMARSGRQRTPLSVAVLDLDEFKTFNDSRGHPAGDRVLEELSRSWTAELRATDVLARHGGDEFALALPICDVQTALPTLRRLQAATRGWGSFCAGVVQWDGEEGFDALLSRADVALYRAKDQGAGTILTG